MRTVRTKQQRYLYYTCIARERMRAVRTRQQRYLDKGSTQCKFCTVPSRVDHQLTAIDLFKDVFQELRVVVRPAGKQPRTTTKTPNVKNLQIILVLGVLRIFFLGRVPQSISRPRQARDAEAKFCAIMVALERQITVYIMNLEERTNLVSKIKVEIFYLAQCRLGQ